MIDLFWIIPLAPALAFLIIGLFAKRWPILSGYITIAAVAAAWVIAMGVFLEVGAGAHLNWTIGWISIGSGEHLPFGFQIDPLAAIMLVVVTSVSLLVQVYSQGYMHGDPGYGRYYAFMALFTMSMLGLVLANNFLTIFIFWELVGLCSYLLIGFWYHKPEAADAAKKAFIVTRFGDLGFLIGIVYLFSLTGTLSFEELERAIPTLPAQAVTVAAILIFCGAIGKSAQFPLHVWLPDAMEGPTPVSALIHAATMVAAGVYLVARTFFLFEASPTALVVVTLVGGFTAVFAATMGLVAVDIKRVMAYSTVSQLGYMMLGLGSGAVAAGMFHLFNHAFFKALLFLTAGSVIHAVHDQDLRHMGGLKRWLPITYWTMLIAALSLAGIVPFSGFWSKDEVLLAASSAANNAAYAPWGSLAFAFAMATVFLTAFYMFRVIFLTFHGEYRGHGHPHESPVVMTIPLLVLAVPSVLTGLWGSPLVSISFAQYLAPEHHEAVAMDTSLAAISQLLAAAGILLAYLMYGARTIRAESLTSNAIGGALYQVFYRKYWMDELYLWIVHQIVVGGARAISFFDQHVVDGIVNAVARAAVLLGGRLRRIETGKVQTYAGWVFGGLAVIAFFMVVVGTMVPVY